MKPLILVILDGWGKGEHNQGNPIWQVPTPTFDWMEHNFPMLTLQASGIAVGLPWGEEGNSEVGHLTIGAGRVVFQHFPRITIAIKDGSFFTNEALVGAFEHARKTGGKVHVAGLLTSGNVHASFEHLVALLKLAKNQNATQLLLHLFTDGRDSAPKEAPALLKKLLKEINTIGIGTVASLSGRFYAMDRDQKWSRTEEVYKLLTEANRIEPTAESLLEKTYKRNLTDEYVEPTFIGDASSAAEHTVKSGDAIIFFNFREDSALQIAEPFANSAFNSFPIKPLESLYVATMTEYKPDLTPHVAFPPQKITNPLAKVLSEANLRQLHLAESEKAAHVTYFFDGLNPSPFPGEFWVTIPSPVSFRFEETPELSAREIMARLLEAVEEGVYNFILVNFANPDLIAHTGNFDASLKVVALMDQLMNKLSQFCLKLKVPLIITSDHGNIENMLNPLTGVPETRHDPSPVPFYVIDQRFFRHRSDAEIKTREREVLGSLADVAPTVLNLLNISKPAEMSGESLLPYLR